MCTLSNLGSACNNNQRGGQYSLGLFGIPATSRPKTNVATPVRSQHESVDLWGSAKPCTAFMRAAAIAADERERFVAEDMEEWARPVSWGQVEATLAMEGN